MRKAMIFGFFVYLMLSLFAVNILAEEVDGDAAAGTYYGSLSTLYWDNEVYYDVTGQSSSTPVLAFPEPITVKFYKRGFSSEDEFILRAELNDVYYEDNDGVELITDPNSRVRWHSMTHAMYNMVEGDEPSFNLMWERETFGIGFIIIRSSTYFDSADNEYKLYIRIAYELLDDKDVYRTISIQEGNLSKISEGTYYEGDGPYDGGTTEPVDPIDDNDDDEITCNPIDTTGAIPVYAGVTFTKGNNTYKKNEDCSTGRIRRNQPFSNGDVLMTGSGEDDIMEVSLGGGGEFTSVGGEPLFRMRRLSVWTVVPDPNKVRFRVSKGEAMFRDMTSKFKQLFNEEEIIIDTGSAVMSIRGTELYFNVDDNGDTTVFVTHGEVLVEDLYGGELTLLAGQKVDISVDDGLGYTSFITDTEYDHFELFEDVEEESNFIWTVILILIIISPIALLILFFKFIKRKFSAKKVTV